MTRTGESEDANPLSAAVSSLAGVGPALQEKLGKLGVHAVQDLLYLLPLRYEDRTRITPIGTARAGTRALICGEILLSEVAFRGRRNLLCRISDGTGQLTMRLFHFSRSQQAGLVRGKRISCYGDVRPAKGGMEMIHPEYRLLGEHQEPALETGLTGVYPSTEGVAPNRVRALVLKALTFLERNALTELVPAEILKKQKFPPLADALRYLHQPPPDTNLEQISAGTHPCQKRLAFEEILAHHLSLRRLRDAARSEKSVALAGGDEQVREFLDTLEFKLTGAQSRTLDEIAADMSRAEPMMRLIQGDVGSGKTVVAAAACLRAIACGHQVAYMAPTELLAEQHFQSFRRWFKRARVNVFFLSSSLRSVERRTSLEAMANGNAAITIGTHALFQEGVTFKSLALVVIDEQHRFGVHQRLALRDKGAQEEWQPHQLVMTATPIPRTLAMTAYADLDTSIIDELPPGRIAVNTVAMPQSRRAELIERVRDACAQGQQAYWVCPLIEESEQLDYQAAEASYEMLQKALPELNVGLVHGRMKSAEKESAMREFKNATTALLVATTVIEVGVDVANASLMIIENAERMGLSQLHQLRGRVGRGNKSSSCVLMYKAPLSETARSRLAILRESNDGFVVAQKDLELRGPGEVLGTRQTGDMRLRVADLARDADLMPAVQRAAESLRRGEAGAVDQLINRWLGAASRYAAV